MAAFFTIYVEGAVDEKFIRDYYYFLFGKKLKEGNDIGGIINCESKDKFPLRQNDLLKTTEQGGVNLLIFDADSPQKDGGFAKRLAETVLMLQAAEAAVAKPIAYKIFLLPDNQGDGTIEDLLEVIINPAHRGIFDCWQQYEICLKSKDATYTVPAKKSKISSYIEVLYGDSKREQRLALPHLRDYASTRHWNLNSPALTPLKDFLTMYCL